MRGKSLHERFKSKSVKGFEVSPMIKGLEGKYFKNHKYFFFLTKRKFPGGKISMLFWETLRKFGLQKYFYNGKGGYFNLKHGMKST